jgi:hypothetical protein
MVILSAWGNIHHCKNSERAETIAGLLALQAVLPNYGGLIHVENGCAELVSEVNLMQTSNSAISSTVKDIKNLLRLFPTCVFSKFNRFCNEAVRDLC